MIDGPPMSSLVLKRTNRALVVLVPLWLVGRMVVHNGSLTAVPGSLVFAIGVTCGLLCAEWFCVRAFQRQPALPFFERWSGHPRPWVAMGVTAILIMAAREHVCGLPTVEYELWDAETSSNHHVETSRHSEAVDGDPPRFAGHPVVCAASCTRGRGPLCDAILAEIVCDPPSEPSPVRVDVQIDPTSPGCSLVPYFHEASVAYGASGVIDAYDDHGSTSLSFTITGTVERSATGFHSCAAFDAAIGRQIGEEVAGAIGDMLHDEGG